MMPLRALRLSDGLYKFLNRGDSMKFIKGSNRASSMVLAERLNSNQLAVSGDNRHMRRMIAKIERNKSGSRRVVVV